MLVHRVIALDVLCIDLMNSKHLLSYRMAEHVEHFIGPEESGESVHHQGHDHGQGHGQGQAFGVDDQQNVPPPNQPYFGFMQGFRPPPTDEEIFVKLKKHGAEEFVGTTDPTVAEEWLRKFERIAERFNCTLEQKLKFATFLLEKDALDWWEIVPGSRNRPMTLTWDDFLYEFKIKYTPPIYRDKKKREFLDLQQNEMSVEEYDLKFTRLSKYAPEEVATEELKRNRFEKGLRLEIREKMAVRPLIYVILK